MTEFASRSSNVTSAPPGERTQRAEAGTARSPEFADCQGIEELFGIRRSLVYQLLADGCIRSVSLKRKGQARGKRLIDVESVRAYLHSQMSPGATVTAGEAISA